MEAVVDNRDKSRLGRVMVSDLVNNMSHIVGNSDMFKESHFPICQMWTCALEMREMDGGLGKLGFGILGSGLVSWQHHLWVLAP